MAGSKGRRPGQLIMGQQRPLAWLTQLQYHETMTTSPFKAQPFSQNWTVEDTRFLEETNMPAGAHIHPGLKRLHEAVGSHILWLADAGQLAVIPHVEHRRIRWATLWNTVARQQPLPEHFDGNLAKVAADLGDAFSGVYYHGTGAGRDLSWQEKTDHLIAEIERGHFRPFLLSEQYSFENGENYKLSVADWQPQMNTWTMKDRHQPLTEDAQPEGVEYVTVDLPSGELWMADWIRIPEFTEITQTWEGEGDINSSGGRTSVSRNYAEHGVVSIWVGNSDPHVVRQGNRLIVGHVDEDSDVRPVGETVGRIQTKLWCATLIDRQTLVDTLSQVMSAQEAENKVAAYAKSRNRENAFECVQVPAGTYHLYFADNPRVFADQFKTPLIALRGFERTRFVLSSDALTLDLHGLAPEPAHRRSPRPR
jgi:hypothetical protein